jgi:eukaryotic-like serine/threonine-protein kinase
MLLGCLTATAADAPMFRANPQHTGVYDSPAIKALSGIKWKFHTNGMVISSPTVVNGTVHIGSTDHNLYALNAADGGVKWKFKTGSRVTSTPAVANGIVYFGSYDSNFYAVAASTGEVKWKFKTGGEHRFTAPHLHGSNPAAESMPDPFDMFLSSPVVWQDAVYFGSGDGNIYALDAATGKLNWKFHTGDVVHASPAIADGVAYIGAWDSYFYALDAGSGKEKWRFKTGEDHDTYNQVGIQSSALVADGTVYFGCRDSNLYALDAQTGQKKWSFNNKGSWVVGSPALLGNTLYFATSDSGQLRALDARTGASLFMLSSNKWPMFSSPSVAGGLLYVGSHEGKVFAVDLKSQSLAWTFQTDASKENGPALTKPDGTPNYEAAFAGDFYDDMVAGESKMLTVGSVVSSPAVVDGVMYFGSTDGNVYALR